jgi:hypothetical protein
MSGKGSARVGSARKPGDAAWIKDMNLVMSDKAILQVYDKMLNTNHVEAIQQLAYVRNPVLGGLVPPLSYVLHGFEYSMVEGVQVHHNGELHFLASSSVGGQVRVFDSLYTKPNENICKQLFQLYAAPGEQFVVVAWMPFQKQRDSYDCGLFASAVVIEIALGASPVDIANMHFAQNSMRAHCIKVLESADITPFPKADAAARMHRVQDAVSWFALNDECLLTSAACASAEAAKAKAAEAIIARAVDTAGSSSSSRGRVRKASAKKTQSAMLAAMSLSE